MWDTFQLVLSGFPINTFEVAIFQLGQLMELVRIPPKACETFCPLRLLMAIGSNWPSKKKHEEIATTESQGLRAQIFKA